MLTRIMQILVFLLALTMLSPLSKALAGEADCGVLENFTGVGPWDYHDTENRRSTGADPMGRVLRVENVHFKQDVRMLNIKKLGADRLEAELTYVLRAFPNHPYALNALSQLEKMVGGKLPGKSITPFTPRITAQCFFDRAIRFRPDDSTTRMIYGIHLHDRKQLDAAMAEYEKAEALGETSANFYYNLGLLHADRKDWNSAIRYAQKAYSQGFPLAGLRNRIARAGHNIPQDRASPVENDTAPSATPIQSPNDSIQQ